MEDNSKELEKIKNKKLLDSEIPIGLIGVGQFLAVYIIVPFFIDKGNNTLLYVLMTVSMILFLYSVYYCMKLETKVGYYQCGKCGYKYVPTYKMTYFAIHSGRSRYMKCPKCGQRSWNHKALTKDE